MKRKFEWGAVLFTVCFIFIIRFCFLEGPAEYVYMDLFSKSSLKNVTLQSSYQQNGSYRTAYSGLNAEEPTLSPPQQMAVVASNLSSSRTSLGAWGGLKLMLNRSDLPLEVEESFREGLQAWRGLSQFVGRGATQDDEMNDKQCPHSVSPTNATEAVSVPLPCGLILDSSITVVATPLLGSTDFQIELIGSNGLSEKPPVILHYNVRIQGDVLTDQAVIIQNTWTSTSDWGEEERCPSPVELKPSQVDSFDRCVEQVGKILTWKPPAVDDSGSSNWPNIVSGSNKTKPWFPYVEGMLFATTIWVGWAGFHVTVNGKHISSFEYRQGLEPWLVGRVEVRGGLQLTSLFAAGLPVSENLANVPGSETLKAPPLPTKSKKLALFIGVFSSSSNFDRRIALRKSWLQYEAVRSGKVVVRFFIGLHKQEQVNKELWEEAKTFGDIQLLPFVDYYYLITLKTAAICIYVAKHVKTDFVMKTDDDTFVRVDAVLSLIQNTEHNQSLLLGQVEIGNLPERDESNKWYISPEEWPHKEYPPWAHGPGYVFSSDIAKFVSRVSDSSQLKLFKLEDVAMGIWIDEFQRSRNRTVDYVHNEKFVSGGCEVDFVIAHYQTPRQMMCLWNLLQRTQKAVCCN